MKKILLICALFLSGITYAQLDTLGVSPGTTPQFANGNQVLILPYPIVGGYIYGINGDPNNYSAIAQGYQIDEPGNVIGALMFIAIKVKGPNNTPNTKLIVNLYEMNPTGALEVTNAMPFATEPVEGPGNTILASADLFFEEIDTASLAYSYVQFAEPISVENNIAIGIDLSNLKAAGDTVCFLADNIGEANGLDYAFHRANLGGSEDSWLTSNSLFQGALDNNIAIFPVIDTTEPEDTTNIAEVKAFGITSRVYPNPSNQFINVELKMEKSNSAILRLLDIQGKGVQVEQKVIVAQTTTTHQIDVSNLVAGQYLLLIEGNNGERIVRQVAVD